MSKTIYSEFIRKFMLKFRDIITLLLIHKIHPNVITMLGLFITFFGGICFAYNMRYVAVVTIILAGTMDILDGSVAKQSGKTSKFGAFLDSTVDRYSDIFLLGGIFIYYMNDYNFILQLFTVSAIAGSLMISYTRARAELSIEKCTSGFWERPERTIFILLGALLNNIGLVIVLLGIFTHVTSIARIRFTYHALENQQPTATSPSFMQTIKNLVFWEYERYTLAYDIKIIILIILLFTVHF